MVSLVPRTLGMTEPLACRCSSTGVALKVEALLGASLKVGRECYGNVASPVCTGEMVHSLTCLTRHGAMGCSLFLDSSPHSNLESFQIGRAHV